MLRRLRTGALGRCLLYAPRIPSTQTLLQAAFAGAPAGLVCVADAQVAGRGRCFHAVSHVLLRVREHTLSFGWTSSPCVQLIITLCHCLAVCRGAAPAHGIAHSHCLAVCADARRRHMALRTVIV